MLKLTLVIEANIPIRIYVSRRQARESPLKRLMREVEEVKENED